MQKNSAGQHRYHAALFAPQACHGVVKKMCIFCDSLPFDKPNVLY